MADFLPALFAMDSGGSVRFQRIPEEFIIGVVGTASSLQRAIKEAGVLLIRNAGRADDLFEGGLFYFVMVGNCEVYAFVVRVGENDVISFVPHDPPQLLEDFLVPPTAS